MAPVNVCVTQQLRQLVQYHIDHDMTKNALFFAERLQAYDSRSAESAHLLALCHLRLGDHASAYEASKVAASRGAHLACAYVFAQACLLAKRFADGIKPLEKTRNLWMGRNGFGKHTQTSRMAGPDAAAVLCLLGKLYMGQNERERAVKAFEQALKLNPFMWDAFTSLCDMGVTLDIDKVFLISPDIKTLLKLNTADHVESVRSRRDVSVAQEQSQQRSSRVNTTTETSDPFSTISRSQGNGLFANLGLSPKLNESSPSFKNPPTGVYGSSDKFETPTGPATADILADSSRREAVGVNAYAADPPQAPTRRKQGLGIDSGTDGLRTTRGTTAKRGPRIPEIVEDPVPSQTQTLRPGTSVLPPERKRTMSGHVLTRPASDDPGAPMQRRSVRLFNQIRPTSNRSTLAATASSVHGRELKKARPHTTIGKIIRTNTGTSTAGRQVSGNRKPVEDAMDVDQKEQTSTQWLPIAVHAQPPVPKLPAEFDLTKQEEAVNYLLELSRILGHGYCSLSRYQCGLALQFFSQLPTAQQGTPWVLAQTGRAYYEQAAYAEAEVFYKRLRHEAPTRYEDLEIYSTILWFLKREADLAFLAHELIEASWQSPQAWCAIGNSWSLSRDHEQALKAFQRATQLDPSMAYAYTLQGHEHVENEEYDKALTAYRQATCADRKHYNAYYGLGRVYERLGNYDKALNYFYMAVSINPTNAVLICCIGTVLMKQGNKKKALNYFTQASELAPRSVENRLRKAKALRVLGSTDEALRELEILRDVAPDDSRVHYLLGELYKVKGDKRQAVKHYTVALNLDPKAAQEIKGAMERMEQDDEDDMSMTI